MPEEPLSIELQDDNGRTVASLNLYPESEGTGPFTIDADEAVEHGEAQVQILEGAAYEYRLSTTGFALEEQPGIVRRSKVSESHDHGRLTPGLNIGRLRLHARPTAGPEERSSADIEVRPAKVEYRTDYRQMLELITERCTDLLLEFRSPAEQTLLPDDSKKPDTICQRFAFIRSLVTSRKFRDAVQRITALPHRLWQQEESVVPINRGIRPTASIARQIATGSPRLPLPVTHPLCSRFSSMPRRITVLRSTETVDTAENRFIKHALATFQAFAAMVHEQLIEGGRASDARFIDEAQALEDELAEVLSRDFFRSISELRILPFGSPVLQRKGGYREVLAAWLQYDMAARLCWSGGEDVYGAGKRDVAILYEYWIFFRLLEVIADIFKLDEPPSKSLIEKTDDGFGLKLKSDRHLALSGDYTAGGRKLRVKFSYNRTFSRKGWDVEKNFPVAGSWTERMRPDYTLTLWPVGFTEEEAERQEVIVHVHFDAKYRVKDTTEMFGAPDESFGDNVTLEEDVSQEKTGQREGKYKRADLLKMHAYKDAIRRTAGAYVLYPGTQSRKWRGFHEIVPGLGAFGIRPTDEFDDGTDELRTFILEIVQHVCDRASRREQESYHRYRIHDPGSSGPIAVRELPGAEYGINGRRARPPQETPILVAWFVDDRQLRWTEEKGLVVLRIAEKRGAVPLIPENVAAHYILLHTKGYKAAPGLYALRTDEQGNAQPPEVVSANTLKTKHGYPLATHSDYYLAFHVRKAIAYNRLWWDIRKLLQMKRKAAIQSPLPFSATLDEVLNCACRPESK